MTGESVGWCAVSWGVLLRQGVGWRAKGAIL